MSSVETAAESFHLRMSLAVALEDDLREGEGEGEAELDVSVVLLYS